LDHKLGSSNVWIDGLVHQIQLMTYGNGMITTPLPIENPPTTHVGNPQLVLVTNCLICGFYYACKNIVVASCGYIYYLFCMAIYMENKAIVCASATCGKPLDTNWLTTMRFQQVSMLLKWSNPNFTKFAKMRHSTQ
jgi:hypothetical protein